MNRAFLNAYTCLNEVYRNRAFSGIELNNVLLGSKSADKALTTKLVYGVLDKEFELEYIIGQYATKVKPVVKIIIKLGVYCLKYLSIPVYAVVNDCSELTKVTGKRQLVGFVNATLRSIAEGLKTPLTYPKQFNKTLSVKYSFPLWATDKLLYQFGNDITTQILSYQSDNSTHVRINPYKTTLDDFVALLDEKKIKHAPSVLPDCVKVFGYLGEKIPSHLYTVQSVGSILVANSLGAKGKAQILDACAAPGGKSVLIAQLDKQATVTACDIHPHRVELIESYSKRMGTGNVVAMQKDSTVFDKDWADKFDYVLCDAPCSGFGVFFDKPDIELFKTQENIDQLTETQYAILSNCSRYVKQGGTLVYSTCTIFYEENRDIVQRFLKENDNFALSPFTLPQPFGLVDGAKSFLPSVDQCEGYFIARFIKK